MEEGKCPQCGEMIEDGGCECYLDDEEVSLDSDSDDIIKDDVEDIKDKDEEMA